MPPYVDYTLVKPDATFSDYERHCREALESPDDVRAVCVLPDPEVLHMCRRTLEQKMSICAVNDFPDGRGGWRGKLADAEIALECGIREIDTVINTSYVKEGNYGAAKAEFAGIISMFQGAVKVIVETGYPWYTEYKIKKVTELVAEIGAFCIKSSTGVIAKIPVEQKIQHIAWMHQVAPHLTIKIAGDVGSMEQVNAARSVVPAGKLIVGASRPFWK